MARRADMVRAMREKGLTYEEIGQILGIRKQAVWDSVNKPIKPNNGIHRDTILKVKYIGLRNWMLDNMVCLSNLEKRCGSTKLHASLIKEFEPSKKTIDAILRVTGLTYEECFKEEENDYD